MFNKERFLEFYDYKFDLDDDLTIIRKDDPNAKKIYSKAAKTFLLSYL